MKTITFYSYKGGVGRSLALVNIATRLAEFGTGESQSGSRSKG